MESTLRGPANRSVKVSEGFQGRYLRSLGGLAHQSEIEESMKPERFKRTKSVMASSAIALVVAALVIGLSSLVIGPKSGSSPHLGFALTNGSQSFTINGTIYTTNSPSGAYGPSTTCTGTYPALLYPATTRCVVFSVHNNLKATISVTGITTSLDTTNFSAPPADCSGTNLVLPTFSGSFNVTGGNSANSPGVPIELKDNGAPQNDCKNLTYRFIYSGTAQYTEVYATSTGVTSSQNPSTTGQSVTYTATVTASATSSQDPVPSSPTGSVTFKDNGTTICSAAPVTSTGTTTATAQCTVSYPTTAGSPHPITATYANTDGNFTTGSSGSLSQVVNAATSCVTIATSGPNVVTLTGTTTGNYTVASGKTLYLNGGTITGNVTVGSTSSLVATKGSIKGSLTSAGPVSLTGSTISGNITSTGGGLSISPGTTVTGNVTASGAGAVCGIGASSNPVTISGNVAVTNLPASPSVNSFCGLTLKGNLTYESNGAPVVIGGSAGCLGDTISGSVVVQSNTAAVTVGGSGYGNTVKSNLTVESTKGVVTVYGNTVSGNIAVESNTGGGTLTSNSTSSNCTLSGNNPKITVPSATSNTAKGTDTCKVNG